MRRELPLLYGGFVPKEPDNIDMRITKDFASGDLDGSSELTPSYRPGPKLRHMLDDMHFLFWMIV